MPESQFIQSFWPEVFERECDMIVPETIEEWNTTCNDLGTIPSPNFTTRVLTKPRSSSLIGFDGGFKVQVDKVACQWFSWTGFTAWVNMLLMIFETNIFNNLLFVKYFLRVLYNIQEEHFHWQLLVLELIYNLRVPYIPPVLMFL
jgi:hypothetical protein